MAVQNSGDHGGLDQSSQALLDKLNELLAGCTPKEVATEGHGLDYIAGLNELKMAGANMEKKIKITVPEKACQVLAEFQTSKTSAGGPFRILSIGCGDGTFDAIILQAMIGKYPDVKIQYTGIDIDEDTCQRAMKELSPLKTDGGKVEISVLNMDMNSLNVEIPPCDLILAMHSLYYAMDIRKVLTDICALLKTDGCMLILLASTDNDGPNRLFCRFWLHEHGWQIKLSDVTAESLDALGMKYEMEVIYAEYDFTESIRDGFQKPHQKVFLNFITHTTLERYPPAISQLCIEYFSSLAVGQPDQYLVPMSHAFIVCKNE